MSIRTLHYTSPVTYPYIRLVGRGVPQMSLSSSDVVQT